MLVFDFSEICETYKTLDITKRNVLKILAMFYDPIGLLQPIFINLKRLFQVICKQKLNWDELLPDYFRIFQAIYKQKLNWNELLPDEFRSEFKKIMLSLQDMEKISIARNVLLKTDF